MNDFTKLLNKYFNTRLELKNALDEYNKAKNKCRRYLKAENQKQIDLLKFAQENNLKLDEIIIEWNENIIPPLTLMHIKNIRQIRENECRESKKELYNCQIEFSKVCQEINNYLSYDKYKRNSRRQFKYLLNKMGIRYSYNI